MHPRLAFRSWLTGLAALLWLAPGCGQNEGGRCQVDSDCASGLTCSGGDTGNGKCQRSGTTGNLDAALTSDAAPDSPSVGAPEAESAPGDVAAEPTDSTSPAVDAEPVPLDVAAADAAADVSRADTGVPAVDALPASDGEPAVDSAAIDTQSPG